MKSLIVKFSAVIMLMFLVTGCWNSDLKTGWKTYKNEELNFQLNYPETFVIEADENKVVMYHFKEQPVPYFVINVYKEPIAEVTKKLEGKILGEEKTEKNGMDSTKITIFNDELKANIDTYYFEEEGTSYSFSCLNGIYDEICETFEFIN